MVDTDVRLNDIAESVFDRPREITLVVQAEKPNYGEGLDLGLTYLALTAMRDELRADRVEVVSGRKEGEVWKVSHCRPTFPRSASQQRVLAAICSQEMSALL